MALCENVNGSFSLFYPFICRVHVLRVDRYCMRFNNDHSKALTSLFFALCVCVCVCVCVRARARASSSLFLSPLISFSRIAFF